MSEEILIGDQVELKQELKDRLSDFLSLPERIKHKDFSLPQKLGNFLVDQNLIQGIGVWTNSWGFKYENRKIYIAGNKMPDKQYLYYIFRLGIDPETREPLFPNPNETDQYRFLHETSHAYQKYLTIKENPNNPDQWYTKASNNEIDSNYAILWNFCFKKRLQGGKGLSTWGNVPDYNSIQNPQSQAAIKAIEDVNELVTMYLWHPKYFETFLDYLSGNISGYGDSELENDNLAKISKTEKEALASLIKDYVDEMKKNIKNLDSLQNSTRNRISSFF
jgi:hypothetical protein